MEKSHFLPIKLHHCKTLIYRLQSKIIELKLFLNFVSLLTANYGKANITSKNDKDNKKKKENKRRKGNKSRVKIQNHQLIIK